VQKFKQHITFKILAFSLALTLLTPTFVKFNHIFAHHKHDICLGEKTTTHLHEQNTDCDFYKFKLTNVYTHTFLEFNLFECKEQTLSSVSQYQFVSKFRRLQIALRGPPALI
jgi:hypothetical protein